MWNKIVPFFLCTTALHAAPTDSAHEDTSKSYMEIPLTQRAKDFQEAFEMLKKEKSAGKVFIQLADGTTISNVIDMTPLTNSTLILFRFNSGQGVQLRIVKVEELGSIGYN